MESDSITKEDDYSKMETEVQLSMDPTDWSDDEVQASEKKQGIALEPTKGVTLVRNGFKISKAQLPKKKSNGTLFEMCYTKEPWYVIYKKSWNLIESKIMELRDRSNTELIDNISSCIKSVYKKYKSETMNGIIPSVTLFMGVNQSDHTSQLIALANKIRHDVTPHVANVQPLDASTIVDLAETVVWQLMYGSENDQYNNSNCDGDTKGRRISKEDCTMNALQKWYKKKYRNQLPQKNLLVIVFQEFEDFDYDVLQEFVLLISLYVSQSLPVVFVFGIATSMSTVQKMFPYSVSSKLFEIVFHSHSSLLDLNQILETVFFTHTNAFQLSGEVLELVTDVFLFHDLSITNFVQNIKLCMLEHYSTSNARLLCCKREDIEQVISSLSSDNLKSVKQLLSFRPFLESQDDRTKIDLIKNEEFFRKVLSDKVNNLHDYLYSFYVSLRLLFTFVKDLPRNLLGKTIREIYIKCTVKCVTKTKVFKECMQFINFKSQVQLIESIKSALTIVNSALEVDPQMERTDTTTENNMDDVLNNELKNKFVMNIRVHLLLFLRQIENLNNEISMKSDTATNNNEVSTRSDTKRKYNVRNASEDSDELKQGLPNKTEVKKLESEFEMIRSRFVNYLEDLFEQGLQPPYTQTFHEIFFFDNKAYVNKRMFSSQRVALHTALSNPTHYLKCSCCQLSSPSSVVATLPDTSLAYKLHLEWGEHINLYDWLQEFAVILCPDDLDEEEDDNRLIRPHIRERFLEAVTVLHWLGYMIPSTKKTDHMVRLTW